MHGEEWLHLVGGRELHSWGILSPWLFNVLTL